MTTTTERDDLFTHIHKALRLGLFELTVAVGRTDWDDPAQLWELGRGWRQLLDLLRVHTAHEENYVLQLLAVHDPMAIEPVTDEHRDLDDLLDDLAGRFEDILAAPDPTLGLGLYRDLARFVSAYLPHLHEEETHIMGRIWECCTDEDIATARARFMADTSPDVRSASLRYLLPAIDSRARRALVANMPPDVARALRATAGPAFSHGDVADLFAEVPSDTEPEPCPSQKAEPTIKERQ